MNKTKIIIIFATFLIVGALSVTAFTSLKQANWFWNDVYIVGNLNTTGKTTTNDLNATGNTITKNLNVTQRARIGTGTFNDGYELEISGANPYIQLHSPSTGTTTFDGLFFGVLTDAEIWAGVGEGLYLYSNGDSLNTAVLQKDYTFNVSNGAVATTKIMSNTICNRTNGNCMQQNSLLNTSTGVQNNTRKDYKLFAQSLVVNNTGDINALYAAGNVNNYFQVNVKNNNTGTSVSSDLVATSSDGNETDYFVDLGINGQNYDVSTWKINTKHDAYLYAQNASLAIGTSSSNKNVSIFTGGTLVANERAVITDTQFNIRNNLTAPTINTTNINTTNITGTPNLGITLAYGNATITVGQGNKIFISNNLANITLTGDNNITILIGNATFKMEGRGYISNFVNDSIGSAWGYCANKSNAQIGNLSAGVGICK